MATVRSDEHGKKSESPRKDSTTADECPHYEEEEPRKEDTGGLGSSGDYKFQGIEPKEKHWQERVGFFNEKFIDRQKEANWETENCNCYSFRVCWAFTNEKWSNHVEVCTSCEAWEERDCEIPSHDQITKRLILNDISERRHVPDTQLTRKKEVAARTDYAFTNSLHIGIVKSHGGRALATAARNIWRRRSTANSYHEFRS